MTTKKPKMTMEQHQKLGEEIKEFREALLQPHVLNVDNKTSRASRAVSCALKSIDRMKDALDSVVARDYWDYEDYTHVYYGQSKKWFARQEEGIVTSPLRLADGQTTHQENADGKAVD